MTKREKAARRAERKARRRFAERDDILDLQHVRRLEAERKELSSEDKRTVRDTYDNATALYKSRKRMRRRLFYGCLAVLFCCVGMIALSALFFQVKSISVTGSTLYDNQTLVSACGVHTGENLLLMNKQQIEQGMCAQFPYIESVYVRQKFPDAVILEVTETTAAYALPTENREGEYTLLSEAEKVLETGVKELPTDICLLIGAEASNPQPGSKVVFSENTDKQLIEDIMSELAENDLDAATCVDISDEVSICVTYENRLDIAIGTAAALDYKMRFAVRLIREEIGAQERGTIDVRNASERKASFQPSVNTTEDQTVEAQVPEQEKNVPLYDESQYDPASEKPYLAE